MPRNDFAARHAFAFVGLLAAGFASGTFLQHRAFVVPSDSTVVTAVPDGMSSGDLMPMTLDLRSSDTIETLLLLSMDEDLYGRLALWLVDASLADLVAYWDAMKGNVEPNSKVVALLLFRWTQLDPLGAIQANSTGYFDHLTWQAWAKHDPVAAFHRAFEHDRSKIEIILRTIGQTDPQLALKLLQDHPELPPNTGLTGILAGLARDDPEGAANFAMERGQVFNPEIMQAWVKDDPHRAFDWFLAHRPTSLIESGFYVDMMIDMVSRECPELLIEFSVKLPSGKLRRSFESAAFDHLVRQDPAKALEQAINEPSTTIATQKLVKVANSLAETDLNQAVRLLSEILRKNPDFAINKEYMVAPDHFSTHAPPNADGRALVEKLLIADPKRALQHLVDSEDGRPWKETTELAASRWAGMDQKAFAGWAETQRDPGIRDQAYGILIDELIKAHEFEKAFAYTQKTNEQTREVKTAEVIGWWRGVNRTAALEFAEKHGVNMND